jgi:microcystin degradation protein MlrC
MSRRLRVAFGRLMQETNALSPVPTTLADFERTHLLEGRALVDATRRLAWEVPPLFRNVELSGFVQAARAFPGVEVELVPLMSAWAISGGPLSAETYQGLKDRMLAKVRDAGKLDGVYLSLHGAMGVAGLQDPETDLLTAVKAQAGGVPVAASFDLHGNLSRERVAVTDVVCSYLTNPHRDHAEVGRRAARVLLSKLSGDVDVKTAWRTLPMILGGSPTLDFLPPLRSIYRRIRAMRAMDKVLDVSLFSVHPWNDHPELGWSTLVHTDGDQDLAERLADELAEACWGVRHHLPPKFPSAKEAVREALDARLARKLGVVVMADASDVVSAGSVGESTELMRVLVEDGASLTSLLSVRDAETVAAFWDRGVGETLTAAVGGKLDPARTTPLTLKATLKSRHDGTPFGRVVVLTVGKTHVCVTEGAPMVLQPKFYTDLGLDPWKADVVVVKNFFPFRMYFLPMARKTLYVRTGGITDFDAAHALTFAGPVHPRDVVEDWRPTDRRRRGL